MGRNARVRRVVIVEFDFQAFEAVVRNVWAIVVAGSLSDVGIASADKANVNAFAGKVWDELADFINACDVERKRLGCGGRKQRTGQNGDQQNGGKIILQKNPKKKQMTAPLSAVAKAMAGRDVAALIAERHNRSREDGIKISFRIPPDRQHKAAS